MSFRAWSYVVLVLAILAAAGAIYWKGRQDEDTAQLVNNIKTVTPKIARKNEIRNNRPDVLGSAHRMRDRTF